MKLIRLASATFEFTKVEIMQPFFTKPCKFKYGRINVETTPLPFDTSKDAEIRIILVAVTEIKFPEIKNNYVIIPEEKREALESAIISTVNILSVCTRKKLKLSALMPSIALIPRNKNQLKRLDSTDGIHVSDASSVTMYTEINLDNKLLRKIQDRITGFALLSEAHQHNLESGKYREFVRLFELAFANDFKRTAKILTNFLHPNFGYTRKEINSWINFRDPLTHADLKKSTIIYLDSDIRTITHRMEQAAYDVLFNKKEWHVWSKERRSVWSPEAYTTSENDLAIVQGSAPKIVAKILDEFGIFPLNLNGVLSSPPTDWWYKFSNKSAAVKTKLP